METTIKRFSLCVTKETYRQLEDLCEQFGERRSNVITRCIQTVYEMYHPYSTIKVSKNQFKIVSGLSTIMDTDGEDCYYLKQDEQVNKITIGDLVNEVKKQIEDKDEKP